MLAISIFILNFKDKRQFLVLKPCSDLIPLLWVCRVMSRDGAWRWRVVVSWDPLRRRETVSPGEMSERVQVHHLIVEITSDMYLSCRERNMY